MRNTTDDIKLCFNATRLSFEIAALISSFMSSENGQGGASGVRELFLKQACFQIHY